MNLRRVLLLSILGLAPLASVAWPQDVTPRDPPDLPPALTGVPKNDMPTQLVPFLGTATKQATPEERTRAGLPDGVGLSVHHVLAGSPADQAGMRALDVLHKLNDQILINDPQFRVLLRIFKPGDEIRLTVLRGSQRRTVTVRLGKRRVPVGEVPARELLRWMLMPADGAAADALGFSASYEDDQHRLILSCDAQGKRLEVRDKQGKVLFEGPVDTPQERRLVPQSVRAKLKTMETPPEPRRPRSPGKDRPNSGFQTSEVLKTSEVCPSENGRSTNRRAGPARRGPQDP